MRFFFVDEVILVMPQFHDAKAPYSDMRLAQVKMATQIQGDNLAVMSW